MAWASLCFGFRSMFLDFLKDIREESQLKLGDQGNSFMRSYGQRIAPFLVKIMVFQV